MRKEKVDKVGVRFGGDMETWKWEGGLYKKREEKVAETGEIVEVRKREKPGGASGLFVCECC